MAGAKDVATFGAKYLSDETRFRREVTQPVLLWVAPPSKKEEPLLFATRPGQATKRPSPGRAVFFVVEKSVKNAFADEVTLGRTTNNDISIEDNSVSRFHAYLVPPSAKAGKYWSLVDAKSTGGTWLGGKRLQPKKPAAIGWAVKLRVGDVELQLLDPEGFWKYLRAQVK